jgi:hypothetical protein
MATLQQSPVNSTSTALVKPEAPSTDVASTNPNETTTGQLIDRAYQSLDPSRPLQGNVSVELIDTPLPPDDPIIPEPEPVEQEVPEWLNADMLNIPGSEYSMRIAPIGKGGSNDFDTPKLQIYKNGKLVSAKGVRIQGMDGTETNTGRDAEYFNAYYSMFGEAARVELRDQGTGTFGRILGDVKINGVSQRLLGYELGVSEYWTDYGIDPKDSKDFAKYKWYSQQQLHNEDAWEMVAAGTKPSDILPDDIYEHMNFLRANMLSAFDAVADVDKVGEPGVAQAAIQLYFQQEEHFEAASQRRWLENLSDDDRNAMLATWAHPTAKAEIQDRINVSSTEPKAPYQGTGWGDLSDAAAVSFYNWGLIKNPVFGDWSIDKVIAEGGVPSYHVAALMEEYNNNGNNVDAAVRVIEKLMANEQIKTFEKGLAKESHLGKDLAYGVLPYIYNPVAAAAGIASATIYGRVAAPIWAAVTGGTVEIVGGSVLSAAFTPHWWASTAMLGGTVGGAESLAYVNTTAEYLSPEEKQSTVLLDSIASAGLAIPLTILGKYVSGRMKGWADTAVDGVDSELRRSIEDAKEAARLAAEAEDSSLTIDDLPVVEEVLPANQDYEAVVEEVADVPESLPDLTPEQMSEMTEDDILDYEIDQVIREQEIEEATGEAPTVSEDASEDLLGFNDDAHVDPEDVWDSMDEIEAEAEWAEQQRADDETPDADYDPHVVVVDDVEEPSAPSTGASSLETSTSNDLDVDSTGRNPVHANADDALETPQSGDSTAPQGDKSPEEAAKSPEELAEEAESLQDAQVENRLSKQGGLRAAVDEAVSVKGKLFSRMHKALVQWVGSTEMATQLRNNPDDKMSFIGTNIIETGIGYAGKLTRRASAALGKDSIYTRAYGNLQGAYNPAIVNWVASRGKGRYDAWKAAWEGGVDNGEAKAFHRAVFMHQEDLQMGGAGSTDENILAYVKQLNNTNRELHAERVAAGIKGFSHDRQITNYIPHVWKKAVIGKLAEDYGPEMFTELLEESLRSAIDRGKFKFSGSVAEFDELIAKQANWITGLGDSMKGNATKDLDKMTGSRSMARLPLDFTVSHKGVSMLDLIDTNLPSVMDTYIQRAAADIGISEATGGLIRSEGDFIKYLTPEGANNQALFQDVADMMYGRPTRGGMNPIWRTLMDTATYRTMGGIGVAQLAETGTMMQRAMVNFMSSPVVVNKIFKMAGEDMSDNGVMSQIRGMAAINDNLDQLNRSEVHNIDQAQIEELSRLHALAIHSVDKATLGAYKAQFSRALGQFSGVNAVQRFQSRIVQASFSVDVVRFFKDGSGSSTVGRLKDSGLVNDDGSTGLAGEAIKEFVEVDVDGVPTNMNFDKWSSAARKQFVYAMNREEAQVMPRTLIGELPAYMNKPMWQVLMQFKKTPLTFMSKGTQRHLLHGDREAILGSVLNVMSAGLVRYAKVAGGVGIVAALSDEEWERPTADQTSVQNYVSVFGMMPDAFAFGTHMYKSAQAETWYEGVNQAANYIPAYQAVTQTAQGAGIPSGFDPHETKQTLPLGSLPVVSEVLQAIANYFESE